MLQSRPDGLAQRDVEARLERFGPNALRRARPKSAWKILLDQFRSVVVLLLFAAAAVSFLLGDLLDASAIGRGAPAQYTLGFFQ